MLLKITISELVQGQHFESLGLCVVVHVCMHVCAQNEFIYQF